MRYIGLLIPALLLLLSSCGDTIERDEWHNGIYAISAEDTTTLFQIYHDTYRKEFQGISPLYIVVDDQNPTTEKETIPFYLTMSEGESGELTSKEVYNAYENSFSYKGMSAVVNGATFTTAGISLNMSINGISQTYPLHKLREWQEYPFIDSGKYQFSFNDKNYYCTFYPKSKEKYLVLFSDEDSTTEDFTISSKAMRKKVIDGSYYTVMYSADIPVLYQSESTFYYSSLFENTPTGLQLRLYSEYDNEVLLPLLKVE